MIGRKRIAVLIAGLEREYQQSLLWGMEHRTGELGIDLCVFACRGFHVPGEEECDVSDAVLNLPELDRFDGVAVLCSTMPAGAAADRIRRELARHPELPKVSVDCPLPWGVEVTFDDLSCQQALVTHLIEVHGARRLALVCGPKENPVSAGRLTACQQVIASHGLSVPDAWVVDGGWTREGGRRAAAALLTREGELPDAVICGNDDMALGLMETLRDAGVSVPGDVLVTGFDAIREAVGVGLTTIRRPVRDAGLCMVDVLAAWMDGHRPDTWVLQLPTTLILGTSCGCEPKPERMQEYVRLLAEERRAVERSLSQATVFNGMMGGVSDERQAGEAMGDMARRWGVRELHVCVDPMTLNASVPVDGSTWPERMMLLCGMSGGEPSPQRLFASRELLPRLAEDRECPLAIAFCLLHYQKRRFGYAVLDLAHATSMTLASVLTIMAGTLMSLSLQSAVRAYAGALEEMNIRDPLTGLMNRRGFDAQAPVVFEEAKRRGRCFMVLAADMDGMKSINDRFGHPAGDEALRRMARILRGLESGGLTCVHICGDEFLAFGMVRDTNHALRLASGMEDALATVNEIAPDEPEISMSMGWWAGIPAMEDRLCRCVTQADQRMYEQKKSHARARRYERRDSLVP